ncbi:unnamed protein product, partial [Discosporangium mesarthrocarpum]
MSQVAQSQGVSFGLFAQTRLYVEEGSPLRRVAPALSGQALSETIVALTLSRSGGVSKEGCRAPGRAQYATVQRNGATLRSRPPFRPSALPIFALGPSIASRRLFILCCGCRTNPVGQCYCTIVSRVLFFLVAPSSSSSTVDF